MSQVALDSGLSRQSLYKALSGERSPDFNTIFKVIAAGFQGQRAWTDHFPNDNFLEIILNSSFDLTGIQAPYVVATENDALNGLSMLFGHLLTCL